MRRITNLATFHRTKFFLIAVLATAVPCRIPPPSARGKTAAVCAGTTTMRRRRWRTCARTWQPVTFAQLIAPLFLNGYGLRVRPKIEWLELELDHGMKHMITRSYFWQLPPKPCSPPLREGQLEHGELLYQVAEMAKTTHPAFAGASVVCTGYCSDMRTQTQRTPLIPFTSRKPYPEDADDYSKMRERNQNLHSIFCFRQSPLNHSPRIWDDYSSQNRTSIIPTHHVPKNHSSSSHFCQSYLHEYGCAHCPCSGMARARECGGTSSPPPTMWRQRPGWLWR